jgi:NADH-quinone oxidoreductase subunit C
MAQIILDKLKQKFGHAVISTHAKFGNETAVIKKEDLLPLCEYLKKDPVLDMSMIMDVTCVDWPEREEERFDVVYHLYSIEKKHRVRLKVPVGGEPPTIASVCSVWKGANWFEREAFDMYGVVFEGHPDLRRILLYPEFIGYPLRKDYPIDKRQPLIENRLRAVNYGTTGVTGDAVIQGSPLVQIGRRQHHG